MGESGAGEVGEERRSGEVIEDAVDEGRREATFTFQNLLIM